MNHVKCISSCSVCLWIHSNQQKNWCFFYFCNKQSYTLNIVYFSCFAYKVCNPVSPKTPFAMYQQKGVTLCSNEKWKSYPFILKIVFKHNHYQIIALILVLLIFFGFTASFFCPVCIIPFKPNYLRFLISITVLQMNTKVDIYFMIELKCKYWN